MSTNPRGKSPKRDEAYQERVTEAAALLMKSYIEPGPISKRGAIQSEAWHRFRSALNLPDDAKSEKKRDRTRALRKRRRNAEHPYPKARVDSWFSTMMRNAFLKVTKKKKSTDER